MSPAVTQTVLCWLQHQTLAIFFLLPFPFILVLSMTRGVRFKLEIWKPDISKEPVQTGLVEWSWNFMQSITIIFSFATIGTMYTFIIYKPESVSQNLHQDPLMKLFRYTAPQLSVEITERLRFGIPSLVCIKRI